MHFCSCFSGNTSNMQWSKIFRSKVGYVQKKVDTFSCSLFTPQSLSSPKKVKIWLFHSLVPSKKNEAFFGILIKEEKFKKSIKKRKSSNHSFFTLFFLLSSEEQCLLRSYLDNVRRHVLGEQLPALVVRHPLPHQLRAQRPTQRVEVARALLDLVDHVFQRVLQR